MAQRLEVANLFIKEKNHTTSTVLQMAEVPSSTWYIQGKTRKRSALEQSIKRGRPIPGKTINPDGTIVFDSSIINALKKYREQIEFSNAGGYHKLKFYLQRDYGLHINHKKLYRLCRENKLLLPRNKKKITKTRKICINRTIDAPNRLWEFDIKYGYIHGENRHFYVLIFLDVFIRKVVDYHIGLSCKAGDLRFTLDNALKKVTVTDVDGLIIRSDNGPQMTSNMFRDYIADLEIDLDHEFIPPSCSNKNAHVESFNSIFEIEFLQVRYFQTYGVAYKQTIEFIDYYNNRRLHGSVGMLPPSEAEQAFHNGTLKIKKVRL